MAMTPYLVPWTEFCESELNLSPEFAEKWFTTVLWPRMAPRGLYHDFTHVFDLLKGSRTAKIKLAVYFHDLIYDGKSKTNEIDSAQWFRRFAADARREFEELKGIEEPKGEGVGGIGLSGCVGMFEGCLVGNRRGLNELEGGNYSESNEFGKIQGDEVVKGAGKDEIGRSRGLGKLKGASTGNHWELNEFESLEGHEEVVGAGVVGIDTNITVPKFEGNLGMVQLDPVRVGAIGLEMRNPSVTRASEDSVKRSEFDKGHAGSNIIEKNQVFKLNENPKRCRRGPLPTWCSDEDEINDVADWILETARHTSSTFISRHNHEDFLLFLDLDMSILGADPARYEEYSKAVRAEYQHVGDLDFYKGRGQFLKSMLSVPDKNLFRTEVIRLERLVRARENMSTELRKYEDLLKNTTI